MINGSLVVEFLSSCFVMDMWYMTSESRSCVLQNSRRALWGHNRQACDAGNAVSHLYPTGHRKVLWASEHGSILPRQSTRRLPMATTISSDDSWLAQAIDTALRQPCGM